MDGNNWGNFDLNQELMDSHLSLNQEPIHSHPFLDTSSDTLLLLDRAQEIVEERIRQPEGDSSRERPDPNAVETTTIKLMGKVLEINPDSKSPGKETRSFYNCNICLDVAIEPVLTCCGHLFCWACLYPAMNAQRKECPLCKGELSENNTIIPIYCNYGSERVKETETGFKIPPRPEANRVESIRQHIAVHGTHNLPVEALWRIINSMVDGAHIYEAELRRPGGSRVRVNQVSRVLSDSTITLSTLSSALNSAKRLVEELGTVIRIRMSADNPSSPDSTDLWSDEQQTQHMALDVDGGETRESTRRRLN